MTAIPQTPEHPTSQSLLEINQCVSRTTDLSRSLVCSGESYGAFALFTLWPAL
jgi:hypothetical protein